MQCIQNFALKINAIQHVTDKVMNYNSLNCLRVRDLGLVGNDIIELVVGIKLRNLNKFLLE